MDEVVSRSVAQRRLTMMLLAIFAAAALLLAAVGIYGVIAYSVTQRTQEIGIRVALGAQRGDVLRMVVGQAPSWPSRGSRSAPPAPSLLTRLMADLLFGVTPFDPLTFARSPGLLAAGGAARQLSSRARRATQRRPGGRAAVEGRCRRRLAYDL